MGTCHRSTERGDDSWTPHNARDLGPETGRMLSTYIELTRQAESTFRLLIDTCTQPI